MSLQKQGQKIDRKLDKTLAGWVRREGRRETLLRIRIRMFLGLSDPHPDPLITSTVPAPDLARDPSIIKQKIAGRNPGFLLFCDFFMNFYLFGE
jgi:hypothetical protein